MVRGAGTVCFALVVLEAALAEVEAVDVVAFCAAVALVVVAARLVVVVLAAPAFTVACAAVALLLRAPRSRVESPLESHPRFLARPGGTSQSPHPVFLPLSQPGGRLDGPTVAAASWP